MTNKSNIFISKFKLNDRSVYIKFNWKFSDDYLFNLRIYDNNSVWSGFFSYECVKDKCDFETQEAYCDTLEKVFRGDSDGFIFAFPTVDIETDYSEFIIKKKIETGFYVYGSVKVERCNGLETKDSIIDILLNENNELRTVIKQDKEKIDALNDNLNRYKQELVKCSNIKTSLEATLYGKFVQVLNEKKKRIQLLEEHLKEFSKSEDMSMDD